MINRSMVFGLVVLAGCATKRIQERPIMTMGDVIGDSENRVAVAAVESEGVRRAQAARRDSITNTALTGCAAAICSAVARGELALGMNEAQVMAATRTTEMAWTDRRTGASTVLVPRSTDESPRDI